jgi:hypothetical protein
LRVYSSFTRIDPFGNVVAPDRGQDPREILSPALARGATSGFHLVVSGAPGAEFTLYVGQNPGTAAGITLYRERYLQTRAGWIPDAIEPVSLPYRGRIGADGIPNQTAQSFWMDLSIAREAAVERVKIEPQASFGGRWVIYPMEARIVFTTAPALDYSPSVSPASPESPADFTARRVLRRKLCGNAEKVSPRSPLNIRDLIARDAAQDLAMASVVPAETLWGFTGARDRSSWCRAEQPHPDGPEWYLRIRDRVVGAKR